MEKEQNVKNELDSFFELWESEHNKLEESSTTIMDYFRVPIKQLKQWLKIIAQQELKKYVIALKKVFDEKVIFFKNDRLVYFSIENRLVPLEKDSYNIIFFESNRNNKKVKINGEEYYEIPDMLSSDLTFSKISNEAVAFMASIGICLTESDLTNYFRHITLLPLRNFYEDNKIPLSHNMSILNNCRVLGYTSVSNLLYKEDLEGPCLYYNSSLCSPIQSKSPFIFIPSKSLNSDNSKEKFLYYALLNFSEPTHKELAIFSRNFYIILAEVLKDTENIEINTLEDLIEPSLNIINKWIDSIKSEDECISILGDSWNNKVYSYYK